uniref:Ig-like domain-containing protein n=1 Tax=Amphilophus citrinellus TaxID=61819 RepID=A0A3Q0SK47_AMPCI
SFTRGAKAVLTFLSSADLQSSPKLLMEMSDVQVKSGEMAEFSCLFDGQPFTMVVWDHNGQSLVDTERVRSSQSGGFLSLVIQGVSVVDQGMYRCTATNEHGQNSSSAQLTSVSPSGPSHLSNCSFRLVLPHPIIENLMLSFNLLYCNIITNSTPSS